MKHENDPKVKPHNTGNLNNHNNTKDNTTMWLDPRMKHENDSRASCGQGNGQARDQQHNHNHNHNHNHSTTTTRPLHFMMESGPPDEAEEELFQLTEPKGSKDDYVVVTAAIDSGAADNALSPKILPEIPITESPGSRAGKCYISASGGRIPNLGEKIVRIRTAAGNIKTIKFQIADVSKTLISVLKLIAAGNEVILDDNPRIVNKKTNEVTKIRKQNGIFVIDLYIIRPKPSGFTRPGQ
jgi:hypothetical protein